VDGGKLDAAMGLKVAMCPPVYTADLPHSQVCIYCGGAQILSFLKCNSAISNIGAFDSIQRKCRDRLQLSVSGGGPQELVLGFSVQLNFGGPQLFFPILPAEALYPNNPAGCPFYLSNGGKYRVLIV